MVRKTRNKRYRKIGAPKISVYHIDPAPAHNWIQVIAKWPYLVGVLALAGGLGIGSYLSWSSKYSEADLEAQRSGSVLAVSTEEPWSKTLDYDQSELDVVQDMLPILIEDNHREPSQEELIREEQHKKLKAYFEKRKSPFSDDRTVEAFLDSRNMNLMIAISFVESTMGQKCYFKNCSGIGGTPPNLRKYDSHAAWVRDFDELLEKRYKGLEIEEFLGLYVQPGSPNWLAGVKQILAELAQEGIR